VKYACVNCRVSKCADSTLMQTDYAWLLLYSACLHLYQWLTKCVSQNVFALAHIAPSTWAFPYYSRHPRTLQAQL
jgi:hypothetical protein